MRKCWDRGVLYIWVLVFLRLRTGTRKSEAPPSLASRWGLDKHLLFCKSATNKMHVVTLCLSAHIVPQTPYTLPHVATCCHMLPHVAMKVDHGKQCMPLAGDMIWYYVI